jgi:hypothetical protein
MATCPNGHQNAENVHFCGECGTPVETVRSTAPVATSPLPPTDDGPSAAESALTRNRHISLPQVLIAIGAGAIIVSLFLHWLDLSFSIRGTSVSSTGNATWVPVQFLFDRNTTADDPTILVVLIPAAALGLLGAAMHKKVLTFIAGGVSLFVAGMFAYQVDQGLGELTDSAHGIVHFGLSDVIGIAPFVCGIGAVLMVIGAVLLDRAPRAVLPSEANAIPPQPVDETPNVAPPPPPPPRSWSRLPAPPPPPPSPPPPPPPPPAS